MIGLGGRGNFPGKFGQKKVSDLAEVPAIGFCEKVLRSGGEFVADRDGESGFFEDFAMQRGLEIFAGLDAAAGQEASPAGFDQGDGEGRVLNDRVSAGTVGVGDSAEGFSEFEHGSYFNGFRRLAWGIIGIRGVLMRAFIFIAILCSFLGSTVSLSAAPHRDDSSPRGLQTSTEKARRNEERGPIVVGVHVSASQDRLQLSIEDITRRMVKRLARKREVRAVAISSGSAEEMQTEARNKGCDYLLALTLQEEQATVIRAGNLHPLSETRDGQDRNSGWQLAVRYRLEALTSRASSYQNEFKVSEERSPDLQARFSAGELAADQVLKQIARTAADRSSN